MTAFDYSGKCVHGLSMDTPCDLCDFACASDVKPLNPLSDVLLDDVNDPYFELGNASHEAYGEAYRAKKNWPPMNSAHEAYAILLEEVDELWAHVKMNQTKRDLVAMRKEAIQVAAMALRFASEVCDETIGRK